MVCMNTVFGIIIGFLVLTLLVVIHELGHFIAAVRNGVTVKEFGIGFPPRAIAWRVIRKKFHKFPKSEWQNDSKELIFSLNWLPIGGFCTMDGENASDTRKGTFGRASFWAKTKILFAGITFNFIFAVLIFTILAWTGLPEFLPNQFSITSDQNLTPPKILIHEVKPDSPAAKAGLKAEDQILKLDNRIIKTPEDIVSHNKDKAGQIVKITYQRDNQIQTTEATLNPAGASYRLGISSAQYGIASSRYTWSAPFIGLGTTTQLTIETFKGLGAIIGNLGSGIVSQFNSNESVRQTGREQIDTVGKSVSGPLGIVGIIFPAFASSPTYIALIAGIISVSLACMNVLPIPALDGGRWLLIAIYKLRNKTLTKEVEEKIVGRAFMVLIGLIFLITALDIIKILH